MLGHPCIYLPWVTCLESSEEEKQTEQIKKCQYQCGDTKSLRKQFCSSCTTNACPEKYAEFVSTGMLVCTELTMTMTTTTEHQCDYNNCKRVLYANPDDYSECPSTYLFDDETCTAAGDALIGENEMFIELQMVYTKQPNQVSKKCTSLHFHFYFS